MGLITTIIRNAKGLFYPLLASSVIGSAQESFSTQASFLYWKVQENGLAYAVEGSVPSLGRGSILSPSLQWGLGFSVGLGYHLPADRGKIDLVCTLYKNHCTAPFEPKEDQVLFPVWNIPLEEPVTLTQMNQHYRLHLGFIDLHLSKRLQPISSIAFNPFLGISYFSVRQKYHFDYFSSIDPILWRMKNKFWGLGPVIGCSGELFFSKHICLFSQAAVRLVYGQFYTHQEEKWQQTRVKNLRLFDRYPSLACIADATLGLRLSMGAKWEVEVGYDQMLLMGQNQLPHFVQNKSPGVIVMNQGDLSLMGIHLSASFAF